MLRIKLVKSLIGNNERNRRTVASLGLRKLQQVVYHDDTPTIRGMVHKVKHMLAVDEVDASEAKPKAAPRPKPEPKAVAKPKAAKAVDVTAAKPEASAAPKKAAAKPKAEPKPKAAAKPKAKKENKE